MLSRSERGRALFSHTWNVCSFAPPLAFEDYWEDASVSLLCPDDWCPPQKEASECLRKPLLESPANGWTSRANGWYSPANGSKKIGERRCIGAAGSLQRWRADALTSEVDVERPLADEEALAVDETGALKASRSFPPPIASCATLSIKKGGRFVLKEVSARPHGFFRSQRENGRLRLQLIEPIQAENEDGEPDPEEESGDLSRERTGNEEIEEMSRHSSMDRLETVSQDFAKSHFGNATEVREAASGGEDESRVCEEQEEEPAASTRSLDNEHNLVQRIVGSMQIDDSLGFGGQAAMQQQQPPLWMTGEVSLNIWPSTPIFLHRSLTSVSPAAA